MKKTIIFILIFLSFFHFSEYASASGLVGENAVLDCMKAVATGMSSINNPLDNKRTLVCKGEGQDRLYQAILDVKFTEIDLKVETYLASLQGKTNSVELIDDLQKKFGINGDNGSYYYMYNTACRTGIFSYAVTFTTNHPEYPVLTTNGTTSDYLGGGRCQTLFKIKLKSYYDAGEIIVTREAVLGYEASKKTFMTTIKKQYTDLLFKLTIYMGQLGIIKDKWNTKTESPQ